LASKNAEMTEPAKLHASDIGLELVVDAKAKIGESPLWCGEQSALYWIDVKAPALYRTNVDTLHTSSWHLPSDVGGYALKSDGSGAILGLRTGVFALDFASGDLEKLCGPPFDPRTHRFNEGDCDPSGRLWLGTMFDPAGDAPSTPEKQDLYSFTIKGGLVAQRNFALLHNGFAWSRGGDQLFLAHSYEQRVYACEFDVGGGRIGAKRVFAEIPKELGIPDGGAVDEEGFYWSAIHGGGRLHRYAPDGRLDLIIELPFAHPTMPAFGGPALSELYITSATHGKPSTPHEGGVFRLRPGVAGLARRVRICGALRAALAAPTSLS
jgi:sugar lactone lactonase YvrE